VASTTQGRPVEVTVKPTLAALRKQLDKKRTAVMDLRTPYARASVYLDQQVNKNFKTEGGMVGGWAPFARNGAGVPLVEVADPGRAPAKLLQKTGRLRLSFAPFANKTEAGIGSNVDYAEDHHKGVGVPERQLVPDKGSWKRAATREAREIMAQYNKEALATK
jgi:phage gpG-like protein